MWVCSTCAQCRSFRSGRQAGVGLLQAAAVCRLSSEQQVPAAWQLLHCECGLYCHQRRTQLCSSVLQCVLSVRLTFFVLFSSGFPSWHLQYDAVEVHVQQTSLFIDCGSVLLVERVGWWAVHSLCRQLVCCTVRVRFVRTGVRWQQMPCGCMQLKQACSCCRSMISVPCADWLNMRWGRLPGCLHLQASYMCCV